MDRDKADDADDEAFFYVKTLVRRHFRTCIADAKLALSPLSAHNDDVQEGCGIGNVNKSQLQDTIPTLSKKRDVGLAYLLRAIMEIKEDVAAGDTGCFDRFLRTSCDVLNAGSIIELINYLQPVFEALIRADEPYDGTPSDKSAPKEPVSRLKVTVTRLTMEVSLQGILSCFWTTMLDTSCDFCHQPIVSEPPIRTIAKHDPLSPSAPTLHVRIFNRHFSCLERSGVLFVPVSHVWDESIRTANAQKVHNDEAARTLVSTLQTLLDGVDDTYDDKAELWHDYFSVPQWHDQTKEALLVCLPTIYRRAKSIIVHMADLAPRDTSILLRANLQKLEAEKPGNFKFLPFAEAWKVLPGVRAFGESQWMQRMWVTLEYSQAQAACILDGSGRVRWAQKRNSLSSPKTFSDVANGALTGCVSLFHCAASFAKIIYDPISDLTASSDAWRDGQPRIYLGEAMRSVAKKQCQVPRDRFLAIYLLLNRGISPENQPSIPKVEAEARQWVWRHALSRGDYSPLLLKPLESIPLSNPGPNLPSWLVGTNALEGVQWKVGQQYSAAERRPEVTGNSIKVRLDLAGEIEHIHHFETKELASIPGVAKILTVLTTISRREHAPLSPWSLFDTFLRIYPIGNDIERIILNLTGNTIHSITKSLKEDSELALGLKERIDILAADDGIQSNMIASVAESVSKLLLLDTPIESSLFPGKTRLNLTSIYGNRTLICKVRCPSCQKVTLFVLDLRENGKVGDKVYRIPGLVYAGSVENGVGLVLDGERITGRMFHGPPACECLLTETIEIR